MRAIIGKGLVLVGAAAALLATPACDSKSKAAAASRTEEPTAAAEPQATAEPTASARPLVVAPVGPLSLECARFNKGAPCTPTEQRFVNKSVDCYNCLVNASCLNDTEFGDKNHECEDLSGVASGGAQAGAQNSALCLATIDCILATKCAASDVTLCYCGSLGPGTACATGPTPGNGVCAEAEAAGSNHMVSEPASVVAGTLASIRLPAGKADAIFSCAKINNCDALCSR